MKFKARCTYSHCNRVFEKATQGRADQALSMHVARVHKKTLVPPGTGKNRNDPVEAKSKRVIKRHRNSVEMKVNFCPACGCNLQSVALGMVLAGKFNKH